MKKALSVLAVASMAAVAFGTQETMPEVFDAIEEWYAEAVTADLPEGTWLFTKNGQMTDALVEKARQRSITLVALDTPLTDHPIKPEKGASELPFWENRLVRDAWLTRIPAVFCAAWLQACPKEAAGKIALTQAPELAAYAGMQTRAEGLVWRPCERVEESLEQLQKTAEALFERSEELGSRLERLFAVSENLGLSDVAYELIDEICRSVVTLMNGVGVRLARAGDPETAFRLFQKANRLSSGFPSPVLNMGTLLQDAMRKKDGKSVICDRKDEVVSLLKELDSAFNEPEESDESEAYSLVSSGGGELLSAESYIRAGWTWVKSGIRFDDTNCLARVEEIFRERGMPVREMMASYRSGLLHTQTLNASRFLPIVEKTIQTDASEATGWTRPLIEEAVTEMDSQYEVAYHFYFIGAVLAVAKDPELLLDLNLLKADFQARMGGFRTARRTLESVGCFREDATNGVARDPRLYRAELGFHVQRQDFASITNLLQRWSAEEQRPEWVPLLLRGVKKTISKAMVREHSIQIKSEADLLYAQAQAAAPEDLWEIAFIRFLNALMLQETSPTERKLDPVALGEAVLRVRPRDYFANAYLGDEAGRRNDQTKALAYYSVSVTERETLGALNNMTCLLISSGDVEKLQSIVIQLIRLNAEKKRPEVTDTIGEVLYTLGRFEQALNRYREADRAFGGKQPVVRLHIAEALLRLNRAEEASRILQEISDKRSLFSVEETYRYLDAVAEAEEALHSPEEAETVSDEEDKKTP